MKISKRDRILLIALTAILIIGLGYALLISPKRSTISNKQKEYDNIQIEVDDIDIKLAQAPTLDATIKKAYEDCKVASEPFYSNMSDYEIDVMLTNLMRDTMPENDTNDEDDIDIKVTKFTIDPFEIKALAPYASNVNSLVYPLLDYSKLNAIKDAGESSSNNDTVNIDGDLEGVQLKGCTVTIDGKYKANAVENFLDALSALDKKSAFVTSYSTSESLKFSTQGTSLDGIQLSSRYVYDEDYNIIVIPKKYDYKSIDNLSERVSSRATYQSSDNDEANSTDTSTDGMKFSYISDIDIASMDASESITITFYFMEPISELD